MKLTLLRHGITEGNRRRLYYGSTDLPLLSEGWAALEALRTRGGYPQATRYYTSGMIRTEQTLLALYGPVPHEVLPGLREMDFGTFEMRAYEELKHDPAYLAWLEGDVEANLCPGGESGHIVTKRALEALAHSGGGGGCRLRDARRCHWRFAGPVVSKRGGPLRLDTCSRQRISDRISTWDSRGSLGCARCVCWNLVQDVALSKRF